MNAKPIIFRKGEENGIIVERDHFENSIMLNQYQQAINIFNRLWDHQYKQIEKLNKCQGVKNDLWVDNKISNIIAFCGDRGEGKSSCMTSIATILTDENVRKEAKHVLAFPKNIDNEDILLPSEKIDWLDVIDPSFFDEDHNLLELLLGRMYNKVQKIQKKREDDDNCNCACSHRELMEQFQKVKKSISTMTPQKDKKIYDTIEDISDLAAGMRLREEIEKLFRCYLQYARKECLLICIDDLDLNISQGYKMAEMLRKYLINPYCIILVSVKIEQLIDIIATAHQLEVKGTKLDWEYCKEMAQKYVAKLLPRGNQVPMPSAEDICERKIKIAEIEGEDNLRLKELTVKERVVQLIFQKTGYVFYNGQYLSPIVPTNLRSLRHLLSTLEALPDARTESWEDDEIGRTIFKDYFFGTWARQLNEKDYKFAQQLADYSNLSTLNAFVVEYFAKKVKEEKIEIKVQNAPKPSQPKTYSLFDEDDDEDEENIIDLESAYAQLYMDITDRTNTSTNISFGDVMYILWLIGNCTVNRDLQNLIFYIKTVYSMRLYACYNEITSNKEDSLFPIDDKQTSKIKIHKADSLYTHVNNLQRLVNGAYFSYPQGVFLSNKQDKYPLNIQYIKDYFNGLRENSDLKTLRLCEFIALCTVRATNVNNENDDNFGRKSKVPTFLGALSNKTSGLIFDFLQPFYSLCNIKYAYSRFDEIILNQDTSGNDHKDTNILYNIALKDKKSLLSSMLKVRKGQYDDKWDMHGLVSDAIIRIVDVQWAIYDELLRQYNTHRIKSLFKKMRMAYQDIQKIGITLYPKLQIRENKIKGPKDIHTIEFEFLNPIITMLKSLEKYASILDAFSSGETIKNGGDNSVMLEKEITEIINQTLAKQRVARKAEGLLPEVSKGLSEHFKVSRQRLTSELYKTFGREEKYTREDLLNRVIEISTILNNMNK